MGAIGKKLLAVAVVAVATVLFAPVLAAAPIQIGSFLVSEEIPDEFGADPCGLLPDNPTSFCYIYTLENTLSNLLGSEDLDALGLDGTEPFENVVVEGLDGLGTTLFTFNFGDVFFSATDYSTVLATLVRVTLSAPSAMVGTLSGPLCAPPFDDRLCFDLTAGIGTNDPGIYTLPTETQPVPEPATLGLVAFGVGVAWARRRRESRDQLP